MPATVAATSPDPPRVVQSVRMAAGQVPGLGRPALLAESPDPYARGERGSVEPPRGFRATFRHLGPGMILAGSVVGSGELIVTTKLGAVAGFALLWFVVVSCVVKVVVQTELARYTISSGQTFLRAFNDLPGPSGPRPGWLTVPWMIALVAACSASLAVFVQLEEDARDARTAAGLAVAVLVVVAVLARLLARTRIPKGPSGEAGGSTPRMNWFLWLWLASMLLVFVNAGAILGGTGQVIEMALPGLLGDGGARYWSILVALLCGAILLPGTYASLEKVLVVLVSAFTFVTVACTVLLARTEFRVGWPEIQAGLSFGVPAELTTTLVLAALAMYAGTGVAFGEMWTYTYWCIEKGYARNVGDPRPGPAWERRARGWIRVMYTDAGVTMVVYTASTVCFYLLGAAILHVQGLDPDGRETLAVLSAIYTDGVGEWAAGLFLVGAFFVLISTVLSGAAGSSRMLADALSVMGLIDAGDFAVRMRYVRGCLFLLLAAYCAAYWLFENPPQMLLVTSSLIAAVMYPCLGLGTLYLRHRRVAPAIAPGRPTTVWLWVCALVLAVVSPAGILLTLAIAFGWIRLG